MNAKILGKKPARRLVAPMVRVFSVSAIALALSVFATESHADDVGAFGGGGGGPFRTACESGHFVVGLDTMATHVIDGIAPVCGDRRNDALATYGRPLAGGVAGTVRKPRCPPDSVLTILHVFIDNAQLVNRVGFTCWNTRTNEMTDSFPDYGGEAVSDLRLVCPLGEVGTGIYGRAGTAIDQLGLTCGKWQVAAATETPATPPPEKKTPDKTPPKTVKVLSDVDVYDAAGGNGAKTGTLVAGTQGVTLVEACANSWCHVNWPAGNGWVYNGTPPDFQSLDLS